MQPANRTPTLQTAADLGYDPWDPAFVADPSLVPTAIEELLRGLESIRVRA